MDRLEETVLQDSLDRVLRVVEDDVTLIADIVAFELALLRLHEPSRIAA